MRHPLLLATIMAASALIEAEDFSYQQPAKEIQEVLNAPATPLISVSPQRDYAILMQGVRYPSIAEVAQPMLRLAGIRIDTKTNGMHLAPYFVSFSIKRLADGADVAMTAPQPAKLGAQQVAPYPGPVAPGRRCCHPRLGKTRQRRSAPFQAGHRALRPFS